MKPVERNWKLPGVLQLWRIGARSLARFTGLAASVYIIQFAVSAGGAWVMSGVLSGAFARRPLFDRAIAGDVPALLLTLGRHPDLIAMLIWVGMGALLLYLVLSWFLTGGVVAVMLRRPPSRREVAEQFGRGGAATFIDYTRIAILSLPAHAVVIALAVLGGMLSLQIAGEAAELHRVRTGLLLLAGLAPAALLGLATNTAIDYARIDLSRHPHLRPSRALLRAFRLLFTRRQPLAHAATFWLWFLLASSLYLLITWGRPMQGTSGALSLLVIGQLAAMVRFASRFALMGGQVEFSQLVVFPPHAAKLSNEPS
jgi:hypothetical protein